jgi:hypothetical protein
MVRFIKNNGGNIYYLTNLNISQYISYNTYTIMPRTSSRSTTSKSANSHKNYNIKTIPPPLTNSYQTHFPQVQQQKPSFFSTLAEGFSLGVGSSLGRHAVDSIFSSATLSHPPSPPQLPDHENAEKMIKLYNDCMVKATSPDDTEKCEKYNIHKSSQR